VRGRGEGGLGREEWGRGNGSKWKGHVGKRG